MELDLNDVLVTGIYTASNGIQIPFRIYSKYKHKVYKSSKVLEVDDEHYDFISTLGLDKIYRNASKIGKMYADLTNQEYTRFLTILNTKNKLDLNSWGSGCAKVPGTWSGTITENSRSKKLRSKLFNSLGKLDPKIGSDLLGGKRHKRTIKRKRRSTRRRSA